MANTIKEYDNNGNMIHYRNSRGFEEWREYDTNGNVFTEKCTSKSTEE